MKLSPITLSFLLLACTSRQAKDYIELDRHLKTDATLARKKNNVHTIYDVVEVADQGPPIKTQPPSKALVEENDIKTYVVKKDDNLSYIALQFLGSRKDWQQLQAWNQDLIKNPDIIYEGMEIKILGSKSGTSITDEFKIYTVKEGDNLAYIAQQVLGARHRWPQLQEWNSEVIQDPSQIKVGMEIKYIPRVFNRNEMR